MKSNVIDNNQVIGKNIIGTLTLADNGLSAERVEQLRQLEQQAIRLLQTVAKNLPNLHLAYSGGKDSEVVMHLAEKAQIPFTPFYNNTTIDPPGTLKYIKSKPKVIIRQPRRNFFTLIEHRGLPSTFQRFCCDKLKEQYVAQNIITGVRRSESKRRTDRYTSPVDCHVYKNGKHGQNIMPILYWTLEDVADYITLEKLQCHPIYYDNNGKFQPKRRLGCMACPLAYDHGYKTFKQYPRLVKAWCRALAVYRNTRPEITKSIAYFQDEYENFYHNLFHHNLEELQQKRSIPGWNPRQELEREFCIKLPIPKAPLDAIIERLKEKARNR